MAHAGTRGLLRSLWVCAARKPLLGTPASPAGKRHRLQDTCLCPLHTPDGHLEACAQSNHPQLFHQRPAAPLDGGELPTLSGRFVPTQSQSWSLPTWPNEQKPSLTFTALEPGGRAPGELLSPLWWTRPRPCQSEDSVTEHTRFPLSSRDGSQ